MKQIQINLLELDNYTQERNNTRNNTKNRKSLLSKTGVFMVGIFACFLLATAVLSYQQSQNEESRLNKTLKKIHIFGPLNHFGITQNKKLAGEKNDRVNILVLGIGGPNHEGSYLTDTIVLASIKPKEKKVGMVSLPRDLLVEIPGYGWRKINNAHAFGEMQKEGYGPVLLSEVMENTFDIPIHYYVRVDFDGFVEVVDILGGIDVFVDNSFTDYQYPTKDKKYQVVSFAAGPQTMNGDTALKYSRSRHSGMAGEGSDFARSKRQQKVLMAIKQKMLSTDFFLKPSKISNVLQTLSSNMATNLKSWEMIKFVKMAKDLDAENMFSLVFDDGINGYLFSDMVQGAYVLKPKDGTYEEMSNAIDNIFSEEIAHRGSLIDKSVYETDSFTMDEPAKPEYKEIIEEPKEPEIDPNVPSVMVKNGTYITGLAGKTASLLEDNGFTVPYIGNATSRDWTKNVIYDLTRGIKKTELETLSENIVAEVIEGTSPETDANTSGVDFLVILGDKDNTGKLTESEE